MTTATMTSKGQVTIPASIRAVLGLESGSRIEFVEIEKGKFLIVPATSSIHELKGIFKKSDKAVSSDKSVSIEEMNLAIAQQGAKAR